MANAVIEDRYQIIKLIGEGGMSNVYLAQDMILKRRVAIKVLRGELTSDEVSVRRFQREAIAATTLSHPNIVDVYDVGKQQGRYFIVMEYVEGQTLKELLQKRGSLSVYEAVDILKQVSDALAQAHLHGIVHRDIKPQNILINDSGIAKITDFGIATAQHMAQLTQSDVIMGSLHYLSPEVARGETATNQADIYALGIVLYELLLGKVPFDGDTPVNIAFKHIREATPSVRMIDPSIPQSVENIIIKATAKNVSNRYQTADQMHQDLVECLKPNHLNDKKIILKDDDIETDSERLGKDKPEVPLVKKLFYGTLIVFVLSTLVIFGVFTSRILAKPKMIPVPNLVGLTQNEAQIKLEELGLLLGGSITEISSDTIEAGQVIQSNPSVGVQLKKGSTVQITISLGKNFVMPNFVNRNVNDARTELENNRFKVDIIEQANAEVEAGTVLSQWPVEGEVFSPTQVNRTARLTVSSGFSVFMPSVIGYNISEAESKLISMDLTVELNPLPIKEGDEDIIKRGVVISQNLEPNYKITEKGTKVILSYYPNE